MVLRYLDEWGLDKKSRKIVKRELSKWIAEFIVRSSGDVAEVRRLDFKNNDVFYFTNCQDILNKKVESRGKEKNVSIKDRKDNVMITLFLKQLIGAPVEIVKSKCTHCGFDDMELHSCGDGFGYFHFCPRCEMIIMVSYPMGMRSSGNFVIDFLNERHEKNEA